MIDIKTDWTRLTRWKAKIASGFTGKLTEGEWVSLNNNNEIAQITANITVPGNAYPLITPNTRADANDQTDLIIGPGMVAETDMVDETGMAHGVVLTIGGTAQKPGRLKLAATGDWVVAYAMQWDATAKKVLFRWLDGYVKKLA